MSLTELNAHTRNFESILSHGNASKLFCLKRKFHAFNSGLRPQKLRRPQTIAPAAASTWRARFSAAFLALGCAAQVAFAGTVITNNLPANTAIINIDSLADGAAAFNDDQSLWYHPYTEGGSLLAYSIEPGTYTFRIVNPADAMTLFPSLTSAQANQIYTAWTYNSPWITDYLVFDGAAATNYAIPQLLDGAFSNTNGTDWHAYGSPDDAYSAAISGGFCNLLRTSDTGGRSSTTFLTEYSFTNSTTLIFAVPDFALSDNFGGVSVLISPAAPSPGPTLLISKSAGVVTLRWATNASDFVLAQSADLRSGAWTNVGISPSVLDTQYSVTLPMDTSARFFRLQRP
jgi:hypothetical protein